MIERSDLAQRLPEHRKALSRLGSEFAEHVKTRHPKGIPATSCHLCNNYNWLMQWQEFFIRNLESGIEDVSQFRSELFPKTK